MKKLLSVLLCISFLFSLSSVAFAQPAKEPPVLFVAGLASRELVFQDDGSAAFPPSGETIGSSIMSAVFPLLFNGLLMRDWNGAAKALCKAANGIFEPCKMKPDTTSLYRVDIAPSDRDTTSAEVYNNGGEYFFTYDWRYSPLDIAELLNDRINEILANTGCEKIKLYSHSMGGCVVLSYLEKYGYSKVDKLLLTDSAFQGMDFVGELFNGKVHVNADSLTNFLSDLVSGTEYDWVAGLLNVLYKLHLTDALCKLVNEKIVGNMIDTVCVEMRDFIFMLPAIWSFCPAKDYPTCRKFVFGETPAEEYKILVEKTDYYIYNVQSKIRQILDGAIENGIELAVVASYNRPALPIVTSAVNQSDGVIDAKFASIGATVAPFGKTLGSTYQQAVKCGHNHLSADLVIDASTCLYPEYTWFIRNIGHSEGCGDDDAFCSWILNFDGQPTVFSDPKYPQFFTYDRDAGNFSLLGTYEAEN